MTEARKITLPPPFAAEFRPVASAGTLVIAFASIGHDPARMPAPEFSRLASGPDRAALFFSDQSRSWASAPGWADALRQAAQAGVHLLALDCHTEPDRLEIRRPVEIRLR